MRADRRRWLPIGLVGALAMSLIAGGPAQSIGPGAQGSATTKVSAAQGPAAQVSAQQAPTAGGSGSAHVVAVGDIAAANGLDDAVADRVAALGPDALLLLGDIAYTSGSASEFAEYFAPDWSRFSDSWFPVPGNHEYRTPGVAGYRQFFGVPSGPLYFTAELGSWRLIGLDSETPDRAAQEAWLRDTLAAHDGQPTLVVWHRPRFSSGQHADQPDTEGLWSIVSRDPDVRLVLWGHDHDYERMRAPRTGGGSVPAMVVGTGGGELRPTPSMPTRTWRKFYVDRVTGVLDLQLGQTSFTWRFVTAAGKVMDEGSRTLAPPSATVRVRSVQARSKLRVNVNPNMGSRAWRFTVQRMRSDGTWRSTGTYRTRGTSEVRTLNLRRGTYRVVVAPRFGYRGTISDPVRLRR